MKQRLATWWYEGRWWLYLLLPLAWLYRALSFLRRRYLQQWKKSPALARSVPVVVVGNITVGGTGKTPLLMALATYLQRRGHRPGIISRGYGSRAPHYPFTVSADTAPELSGDEPLLLARRTGCPVVIGADRVAALNELLQHFDCDVVLSDDGLQHYRLPRDLEIVVIDGKRGLGNGLCFPAGPLREGPARLREVDWVVINGEPSCQVSLPFRHEAMQMRARRWWQLPDETPLALDAVQFGKPLHALAGIGNPGRFFETLRGLNLHAQEHAFDDHHAYTADDIDFGDHGTVVMTEKDATKIRPLLDGKDRAGESTYYYLEVDAEVPQSFLESVHDRLHTR